MAQLGARFHGMEEVIGSIPIRSTNNLLTQSIYRSALCAVPFAIGAHEFVALGQRHLDNLCVGVSLLLRHGSR